MIYAKDLMAKTFPPEICLVDSGLLRNNSLLIIGGEPKRGRKSFVLTTMMMQMACGHPVWNVVKTDKHANLHSAFGVEKPCRILYFEQEVGDYDMQQRLRPMLTGFSPAEQGLILDNFCIHSCDHDLRLDEPATYDNFRRVIEQVKPDFVGFDPLREFHYSEENSSTEMAKVIGPILKWKDEYGFAVGINHHTIKLKEFDNGAHDLRGSGYLHGVADTILMLRAQRQKDNIIAVEPTLRRGKPIDTFFLAHDKTTLLTEFVFWAKTHQGQKVAAMKAQNGVQ